MTMPKESGLIEAIVAGDLEAVRLVLSQGAGTEVTDGSMTPLHEAAALGHYEIALVLIAAGANMDARDSFGRTPLIHAVVGGSKRLLAHLLLSGATLDKGPYRSSAVELAKQMGRLELAHLLELASRTDLAYMRRLARSVVSWPTNASATADRRIVSKFLSELGHPSAFEPLLTAFMEELRAELPKPTYTKQQGSREGDTKTPARALTSGLTARRANRFTGLPPESGAPGSTWVVAGTDGSVLAAEVSTLEEDGDYAGLIRRTRFELSKVVVDGSSNAGELFDSHVRQLKDSGEASELQQMIGGAVMLYTDDRFYKIYNGAWRAGRSRDFLGFSTLMSVAFKHAAYFMGNEAYRGVALEDVVQYEPGLIFRWPSFVSASNNRSVARQFGDTLVVIEVPSAASVRQIAYWSHIPMRARFYFAPMRYLRCWRQLRLR